MNEKVTQKNHLKYIFANMLRKPIKVLSKKWYISLEYRYITHHKLHWSNPIRYTEKLQYLRYYVYPKNDLVTKCAGRVTVRDYLKENNLKDILIPIYGVYDNFDDIDFNKLPNEFVMKCSHACAFNEIVLDKNKLDLKALKGKFNKWLKTNYAKKTLELHYFKIKPQIIIEKYMGSNLLEYKIHVFNGKAKYLYLVSGRFKDIRYNNYYIDFTPFDEAQFNGWKKKDYDFKPPLNYQEMINISEKLAKPFPFVRVDLYNIDGKIYFSEMTFTPAKGTLIFDDDKADFIIGNWLDISKL